MSPKSSLLVSGSSAGVSQSTVIEEEEENEGAQNSASAGGGARKRRSPASLSRRKAAAKPEGGKGGGSATRASSVEVIERSAGVGSALNAEGEWRKAALDIKSGEWERQFEACNSIRRLSGTAPQLFSSSNPYMHGILLELIKLTECLRSQVSRNALLTFADVFENLKRQMDASLDTVVPSLLKKAGDTNQFIAEEAEKALMSACRNCTESRVLLSLIHI